MRFFDIIKKKRDGYELSSEEINYFIENYVNGNIPDYQVSALLMAIYYKGMNFRETCDLTFAIRDSGAKLSFNDISGIRVDKHSTGGVGDKTSLIVVPIVASLGVKVAKMSGRGLGHTGGTIDKLESIPNFSVNIPQKEFIKIVNEVGACIIGQTENLAPADKKLYALRDVTATIDSIPLVVSSIMGKKLCADDDCIVLDVKMGSGAFCKTIEESRELAKTMVEIGKKAGKKILAVISDMDIPLGNNIGNSLEVIEAVNVLRGNGPSDLTSVCIALATDMLVLAGKGDYDTCQKMVEESISSKKAYNKLIEMVKAQGGNHLVIEDTSNFDRAKYSYQVKSEKSGYIESVNTEGYGIASLLLGAGRNTKEDTIDYLAGIILNKKTGDYVEKGEVIATLYANDSSLFSKSSEKLLTSTKISSKKPDKKPLIIEKIY